MSRKAVVIGVAVLSAAIAGRAYWPEPAGRDNGVAKSLVVPVFSEPARAGETSFNEYCAVCHGAGATGTENGPSLIDAIYRPGLHSDMAFMLAAKTGVRAHHWGYGSMPPVEGFPIGEIDGIVRYIRELQEANGIK